jgi:hypothetical protein
MVSTFYGYDQYCRADRKRTAQRIITERAVHLFDSATPAGIMALGLARVSVLMMTTGGQDA